MPWAYVGFERSNADARKEVAYMKRTFKRYKNTAFKIVKVDPKTHAMFRQT